MTDYKAPLVLGVDIGINNTGWTIAEINKSNELVFMDSGCFRVSPDISKKFKYKGTQLVMKGVQMLDQLQCLFDYDFDAVAIETPGGNTQSASAAKALGACGVLVAEILRHNRGKTVLVKPGDVKKCIKPKGKVEKNEVMEYVWHKYDIPNVPRNSQNVYIKAYYEHIADSAVVLEAAMITSKLFGGI